MAIKKVSNIKSEHSLTTAPLIVFADQPSAIQVGPYVSKFTLGVIEEDGGEYPRPVVTIAMPTLNLMRMVHDFQELFTDAEFKEDSAKMLTEDIKKHFTVPGATKTIAAGQPKRLTSSKSNK